MVEKTKIRIGQDEIWMSGGKGHYHQIYPYKNEDGSVNLTNLLLGGSWNNFAKLILTLAIIALGIYGYVHDTSVCVEIQKDPWTYCRNISAFKPTGINMTAIYDLNLSNQIQQQNFYTPT